MAGDADDRRLVTLLLILSVTTGLIDAVSVLGLGKVFTANMTGNIVFLGFAFAGIAGFSWVTCTAALASFMIGSAVAARICKAWRVRSERQWLLIVAVGEALLLWAAATLGWLSDGSASWQLPMVSLTAIAMGARNATVRQLKIADLTTTVLTLTITGLAADSTPAGGNNPNIARRIMAVLAILGGALLGALMWRTCGLAPPLFFAGAVVLLATLLLIKEAPPATGAP